MEKIMNLFRKSVTSAIPSLALTLTAAPAFAAVDLSTVSVDVTSVETLAGIIIVALAAIWPIRKMIKLSNRS